MALIINIETATTACSVCIARDMEILACEEQNGEYTHAENLTVFIERVVKQSNLSLKDIDAIAVSKGPGSYTGLRIGVSVAKGLCYALDKPMIGVNTLQHMALSVSGDKQYKTDNALYCSMIDARRMEVYCAVFDVSNKEIIPVGAEIINEHSFADLLKEHPVYFFGNGANKCKELLSARNNAFFIDAVELSSKSMVPLSSEAFTNNKFEPVFSFEPYYLKDFLIKKSKL